MHRVVLLNADHTPVIAQVTGFATCFESITKTIDAAIASIGKMSCESLDAAVLVCISANRASSCFQ